MISIPWRKRFSILQNRLYLYPSPEAMPPTPLFWVAVGLVTVAVIVFSSYFILYLTGRHDALLTTAEDLGIMDQALWNWVHNHTLHQSICNILHDTNCYSTDGVNRFAIHVEPILFPISWLYLIWPGPKTLLVLQTLVVALGAYPAFLLARLRLRNELAGVAIALLYLLYPAQQQATVYDFHAVTLAITFLLFMLYFMYTRRTVWVFVFAILAMACKEQIPLVIIMLGLWSMVFQRRWRTGLALVLLGALWFGVIFYVVIPAASPTGKALLIGRFDALGNGPVQVVINILRHPRSFLKDHVIEHSHRLYLMSLVSPAAYLPIFAPWVLVLALPTVALNLISANAQMYSGLFQYNAEVVPILIFATIESIVLILWLVQLITTRLRRVQAATASGGDIVAPSRSRLSGRFVHTGVLTLLLVAFLFTVLRSDYYFHGNLPFSQGFHWPRTSAHTALAQHFVNLIPPDASVSAQSTLVPHISQRKHVYLFPYAVPLARSVYSPPQTFADYVFLDVTADIYPYYTTPEYVHDIKSLMVNDQYGIVAAQDGYLLLKRGLSSPGLAPSSAVQPGPLVDNVLVTPNFPASFCTNMYASPSEVTHPLHATFTSGQGNMSLIGYSTSAPGTVSRSNDYIGITTYWQVTKPITSPLQVLFLLRDQHGKEYYVNNDVPGLLWCQTQTWEPGRIIKVTTRQFNLRTLTIPNGLAQMSIALLPLVQSSSKIMDMPTLMDVQERLPVHLVNGSGTVSVSQGTNALQLIPMTIAP